MNTAQTTSRPDQLDPLPGPPLDPLPNHVDEGNLLRDILAGDQPLYTLPDLHDCTLPELLDWLESPRITRLLARLRQAAAKRAETIAADLAACAITALDEAAQSNHATPETKRKAATTLLRALGVSRGTTALPAQHTPTTTQRKQTAQSTRSVTTPPTHPTNSPVQRKTNLDLHLPVRDRPILDVRPRLDHLEPPHVADRLVRVLHRTPNRRIAALRARPHHLNNLVDMLRHRVLLPAVHIRSHTAISAQPTRRTGYPTSYALSMNVIQKLRQLHTDIAAAQDRLKIVDAWALAERLALRLPVNLDEAQRVFAEKDAAGLDALIAKLEAPPKPAESLPEYTEAELIHALKAFRKRYKVQRLADESRLGGRYTSGGRQSKIDAITPPEDFPPEIWKVLARDGKLKDTGQGFYTEP